VIICNPYNFIIPNNNDRVTEVKTKITNKQFGKTYIALAGVQKLERTPFECCLRVLRYFFKN